MARRQRAEEEVHSSLAYLQRFPVHSLKIDQSFMGGVNENPNDTALVTAIIAMARTLRLKITAEGVETAGQASLLKTQGGEAARGFYFGQAVAPAPLVALLKARSMSRRRSERGEVLESQAEIAARK